MAQIIPQYNFGEQLGKQMGSGLSGALDTFARMKLQDVMERQKHGREEQMLGEKAQGVYSPEEIKMLSIFPYGSKEQQHAMQMMGEFKQSQPASGQPQDIGTQMMQQLGQQPTAPRSAQEIMIPNQQQAQQPTSGQQLTPQQSIRNAFAAGVQTPQMKQSERQFQEKMNFQKVEATKKERASLRKYKQNAEEDVARLNKLEKLSDAGNLPNDLVYKFLDSIGMSDVGSLVGMDATEFNKIITDFTSKAKDRYGARISNFELGTFLRGLPSLLQTPEGRKQVIKDLKLMAELPQERYRLMRQISSENNGVLPQDFEDEIEDKAAPFVKNIFSKYNEMSEEANIKPSKEIVLDEIPDASKYTGKRSRFPSGKIYKSNGSSWILEQK